MNTRLRRVLLGVATALGFYVGVWAAFFPEAFYRSFPGFGLHWIDAAGPYDEHLVRDVGGLYLGLAVAGVAAIVSRSAAPGRVVGLAWAVFGILHFAYHVQHLEGSALDVVGNVVSLTLSAALGLALLLPPRTRVELVAVVR